MADGLLSNIGDALVSFGANTPRSQVRQGRVTRELLGGIESLPEGEVLDSEELRQLSVVNPARAKSISEPLLALDKQRQEALFTDALRADKLIEGGFNTEAVKLMNNRIADIEKLGGDPTDTIEIRNTLVDQGGAAARKLLAPTLIAGRVEGVLPKAANLTSELETFNALTAGLPEDDVKKAMRIKLGLDPRAVGSAIQTITQEGTAAAVGGTEAVIAGATETARLSAQLKLKPQIEAAVNSVILRATADADIKAEDRSNQRALQIYDTSMRGLAGSLGDTTTGPVAGLMPAITSNQQIADGAIAAMAPVLKQLFRASGEGQFTDKDQELLLEMIPTRTDTAKSREAKFKNIDAIVRAKLAPLAAQEETPQQPIVVDF